MIRNNMEMPTKRRNPFEQPLNSETKPEDSTPAKTQKTTKTAAPKAAPKKAKPKIDPRTGIAIKEEPKKTTKTAAKATTKKAASKETASKTTTKKTTTKAAPKKTATKKTTTKKATTKTTTSKAKPKIDPKTGTAIGKEPKVKVVKEKTPKGTTIKKQPVPVKKPPVVESEEFEVIADTFTMPTTPEVEVEKQESVKPVYKALPRKSARELTIEPAPRKPVEKVKPQPAPKEPVVIVRPTPKKTRQYSKDEKALFKRLDESFTYIANLTTVIEEKTMDTKSIPDLTIGELHVIEMVNRYNNKPMSLIANKLKVTVGSLTIGVNRLVQKDYLLRIRDEMDHRVILLSVTPKGKKVLKVHDKFHEDILGLVLDTLNLPMTEKIITQFAKVLEMYYDPIGAAEAAAKEKDKEKKKK